MKKWCLWFLVVVSFSGQAAADISVLQEYVGLHPVLSLNEQQNATGLIRVVANEERVGFEIVALPWSTNAVPNRDWTVSTKTALLEKSGSVITLENQEGTKKTRMEFQILDGVLIVGSTDCDGPICQGDNATLSLGKSIGEKVDTESFFQGRRGTYQMVTSGGLEPKAGTEALEIDFSDGEGLIIAPYCHTAGWCDPGFNFFPIAATSVYRRTIDTDHVVYDVFRTEGDTLAHFRWEERGMENVLKNTQYMVDDSRVTLEHVVKGLGE